MHFSFHYYYFKIYQGLPICRLHILPGNVHFELCFVGVQSAMQFPILAVLQYQRNTTPYIHSARVSYFLCSFTYCLAIWFRFLPGQHYWVLKNIQTTIKICINRVWIWKSLRCMLQRAQRSRASNTLQQKIMFCLDL